MRPTTKRVTVLAAVAAVAVAGGGASAWAAGWFSGNGTSTVSSATVSPIVAQATVVGGKLWPGAQRDASVSVTNPNDFPVRISGASVSSVTVQGGSGACTSDKAKITLGSVPGGIVVAGKPAGHANATPIAAGTFAKFVRMGTDADVACAGVTILVSFALQGTVA